MAQSRSYNKGIGTDLEGTRKTKRMKKITFTLLLAALTLSVFATQNKNTIKLRLQNTTTGYLDEATVFFDEDISPAYNSSEDAAKVFNAVPGVPSFYSYANEGMECSINGYGTLQNTEVVPLGFKVSVDGNYKIIASDINNFDPTSIIRLEDRHLGTFTDLRANFYQASLTTKDPSNGRFFLHITHPVQFSSTNAGCDNNDGTISVAFDTTITWDIVQLMDMNNNPLGTYPNVSNPQLIFNALPEGDYMVSFIYGSYPANHNFHLTGNHVVVSIGTPGVIVKGQEVTFNANASHANQYSWDFGDGTTIYGVANPSLSYLQTGNFTVTVNCSNSYGCTASAQASVSVTYATGIDEQSAKIINVYAHYKTVTVDLNDVTNVNAEMHVYNLLGESVYNSIMKSQKEVTDLDELPNGYYLVSVKNAGKTNTSRVYLSK